MCLSEFVVESCVYYGCVPCAERSPDGFSTANFLQSSSLPTRQEIGLRASARLLNCPDATDDTTGIHEPDAPIKHKRHGHANATLARRHRGIRHANATRLHHRRNHPRRHNPDGLGAPTPGGAADDGVVVAAPAPQGISSELGALAALHRKGALTDSEFAAAKAKLLG